MLPNYKGLNIPIDFVVNVEVADEEELFEDGGFSEAEPDFNGDIVMAEDSEERF